MWLDTRALRDVGSQRTEAAAWEADGEWAEPNYLVSRLGVWLSETTVRQH